MEAKELRVGNYIWRTNKNTKEKVLIQLTASCVLDISSNKERSSFVYEPVELTKERLVSFGFYYGESEEHGYLWIKLKMGELYVRPSYLGGFYWGFDYNNELDNQNNIKHVHQLQNLYFALTNEELTIK